jgi:hypothetical protein
MFSSPFLSYKPSCPQRVFFDVIIPYPGRIDKFVVFRHINIGDRPVTKVKNWGMSLEFDPCFLVSSRPKVIYLYLENTTSFISAGGPSFEGPRAVTL